MNDLKRLTHDGLADDELQIMMNDKIIDARVFDSLARDARNPDSNAPVTESEYSTFRLGAFKARKRSRNIYRYLNDDTDTEEP